MALNPAGLALAVNAVRNALLYAQLHTDSAGGTGTDNLAPSGRKAVFWTEPVAGSFSLASQITFQGTENTYNAHSVTFWDAETIGTGNFYGEFILTGGDTTCNAQGEFKVTAIDFTVTATDS